MTPFRPKSRIVLKAMAKGGDTVGINKAQQGAKRRRKNPHDQRVGKDLAHHRPVIGVTIAPKIAQVEKAFLVVKPVGDGAGEWEENKEQQKNGTKQQADKEHRVAGD